MEACVGSHHLGRQLKAHGHDVRLMPAKYVTPFSKGQKNDYRDAEAIPKAVQRPTIKFAALQEEFDVAATVGCGHVFGLLSQPLWPLAIM